MKKLHKTIMAVVLGISVFFMVGAIVRAAPISDYTEGNLTTMSGYTDLSSGSWVTLLDGQEGPAYVDNFSGVVTHLGVNCAVGGDLEGIVQKQIGQVYTVNESRDGIALTNLASCTLDHRFGFEGFTPKQNDGIEGIEYRDGIIYLLDENSGDVYTVIDDGSKSVASTFLFNADCGYDNNNRKNDASDLLFNGDNLVIICDSSVVAIEYTLDGTFVSQLSYSGILTNAEVGYFDPEGNLWIGGEPNQLIMFTPEGGVIDPPPPPPVNTTETCTFSGTVKVNIDTNAFDSQVVVFDCPTLIADGTLN